MRRCRRWRRLPCGLLLPGSLPSALASGRADVVQLQLDAPAFAPQKIAVTIHLSPGCAPA